MNYENSHFESSAPFENALHSIIEAETKLREVEGGEEIRRLVSGSRTFTRKNHGTKPEDLVIKLSDYVSKETRFLATQAFSDLRNALDYAFNDASVQLGGDLRKQYSFPIAHSPDDLENEIRRRCRGVDDRLLAFVRSLEPFKSGMSELLWLITKLSGKGKHKGPLILKPVVKWMFIEDGIDLSGDRPMPVMNIERELTLASGKVEQGQGVHVEFDLIIDTIELNVDFDGEASFSSFVAKTKDVVLSLKSETERLNDLEQQLFQATQLF